MLQCLQGTELPDAPDFAAARASLQVNRDVKELDWITPGSAAGVATLEDFIANRLKNFANDRNNPNVDTACSGLSAYFHFGQVRYTPHCYISHTTPVHLLSV